MLRPCFVAIEMLNHSHSPLPIFTAAFDPSPAFWRDCTSLSPSSKDLSVARVIFCLTESTPFESRRSSKSICFSSLPFLLLTLITTRIELLYSAPFLSEAHHLFVCHKLFCWLLSLFVNIFVITFSIAVIYTRSCNSKTYWKSFTKYRKNKMCDVSDLGISSSSEIQQQDWIELSALTNYTYILWGHNFIV